MRQIPRNPENIKEGMSTFHLAPDRVILNLLNYYRSSIREGSLDDYLATDPDPNEAESPCLAIPEEFLKCL